MGRSHTSPPAADTAADRDRRSCEKLVRAES